MKTKGKNVPKNRVYQKLYEQLSQTRLKSVYRTYKASPGAIDLLKINDVNEVSYVPLDELANQIIKIMHISKDFDISPRDVKALAHYYCVVDQMEQGLKDLPVPISTRNHPKELCFRRLPWREHPYEQHKRPTHFLEFINRTTDPDVLCAFIGSLFVPGSFRQQYLYLFGHGNDGKGTLFNLLEMMLGQTFTAEDVPEKVSPFWNSGLVGKRLCVFPDLEDPNFPTTPRFRKLTGDDSIRIERKFQDAYSTKIFTKFIFASNDELQLTGKKADKRRALYIAIESFKGKPDNGYVDKLWKEAPAIYSLCIEKYKEMCPADGPILQTVKQELDWDHKNTEDAFFDRYFVMDGSATLRGKDWLKAKCHWLGTKKPKTHEHKMFDEMLKAKGLKKTRDGQGICIKGLRRKPWAQVAGEVADWI